MTSIGIFHMKGGVRKSALSVFLADFLSSLHEQLVVDLDPQGRTSKALIPEATIEKALAPSFFTSACGSSPRKCWSALANYLPETDCPLSPISAASYGATGATKLFFTR